jgi:hypothetical protein
VSVRIETGDRDGKCDFCGCTPKNGSVISGLPMRRNGRYFGNACICNDCIRRAETAMKELDGPVIDSSELKKFPTA